MASQDLPHELFQLVILSKPLACAVIVGLAYLKFLEGTINEWVKCECKSHLSALFLTFFPSPFNYLSLEINSFIQVAG